MKFLTTLLTLIIISSNACFAIEETSPKFKLTDAINYAIEKNYTISGRRKDVEIAKNNINIANKLLNPQFQSIFLTGRTSIGNPQQIGIALPLEIAKRSARKKTAISKKAFEETSLELDIFDLKMDVREAYINLASAKSILKMVEQKQESLKDVVEIAHKRFKTGKIAEIEYLQAEIYYNQLKTNFNTAKTKVAVEKYNFNKVLNNGDENIIFDIKDDDLPESGEFLNLNVPEPKNKFLDLNTIVNIALKNRLDIILANKEIEVAKNNLITVTRQKIPNLTLLGGYAYLSKYQNNDINMSNGGYIPGAYLGGNVDLPILYRFEPEIRNAKLIVEQKELNLKSIENNAKYDVKTAYQEFMVAKANLIYYTNTLLKDAYNVVELSEKGYAKGEISLSSLVIMEQSYVNILECYINALSAYYYTWLELLREMNVEEITSAL